MKIIKENNDIILLKSKNGNFIIKGQLTDFGDSINGNLYFEVTSEKLENKFRVKFYSFNSKDDLNTNSLKIDYITVNTPSMSSNSTGDAFSKFSDWFQLINEFYEFIDDVNKNRGKLFNKIKGLTPEKWY